MKNQKGITLIALIVTIIVMMILVGVTINVTLNGGLFDTAAEATADKEKHIIHEKIVSAMKIGENAKINVKGTYEEVLRMFGNDKVKAIKPTEVKDETTEVTLEVKGKRGTYTYKITGTEIIVDPTTSEIRYDIAFKDLSAIDWNAMIGQEEEVFYGLLFEDLEGNTMAFSVGWIDEPDNYYCCEYYPDLSDTDKYYRCDSDTEYKWIYTEYDKSTGDSKRTEVDAPVILNVKILDAESVTSLGANAFTESQINQIITKTPVNNS